MREQREKLERRTVPFGILVAALLALSCDSDSSSTNAELNLLWIPKERNNAVFWTGRAGALARAKEITEKGEYRVEVTYKGTELASDVEGQIAILQSAKSLGADGVAISCNSADALSDPIDSVVRDGIPVMTFDADSPGSHRFTYLGVDNVAGGEAAAKILGKVMAGSPKKQVGIISGVKGAANLDARISGFQSRISGDYPDLEAIEPVYCNDDGYEATVLIESLLAEHPNLGGLFVVGLWPLYLCDGTDCRASMPKWSAAAASGEIKTVVFDTLDFELNFVTVGMVSGLIGQKYWGWGYEAVQMLSDRITRNKKFESWTDSGLDIVCPNNVEQMGKRWSSMDFTLPLSPCEIDGEVFE